MIPSQAQLGHVIRRVRQAVNRPRVGIIGGYHGINAGDLALGYAVRQQLERYNLSSGLQTIYNLDQWRWPVTECAIIGGGAVGYNDALLKVYQRYHTQFHKVALLGVDFNEQQYSDSVMELLHQAKWISCRSLEQAERIRNLTQRKDISYHPDLAFALQLQRFRPQLRTTASRPLLLINVVPLYGKIMNGQIVPVAQYAKERPELYEAWSLMHERYVQYVRNIAEDALQNNYFVETLPFTSMDAAAAKIIFSGIPVRHHPYIPNPFLLMQKMVKAKSVFATRYHATIFAMKAGVEIIPFAYAKKNEQLLKMLGVPRQKYTSPEQLLSHLPDASINAFYKLDENLVSKLQMQTQTVIDSCIAHLNLC